MLPDTTPGQPLSLSFLCQQLRSIPCSPVKPLFLSPNLASRQGPAGITKISSCRLHLLCDFMVCDLRLHPCGDSPTAMCSLSFRCGLPRSPFWPVMLLSFWPVTIKDAFHRPKLQVWSQISSVKLLQTRFSVSFSLYSGQKIHPCALLGLLFDSSCMERTFVPSSISHKASLVMSTNINRCFLPWGHQSTHCGVLLILNPCAIQLGILSPSPLKRRISTQTSSISDMERPISPSSTDLTLVEEPTLTSDPQTAIPSPPWIRYFDHSAWAKPYLTIDIIYIWAWPNPIVGISSLIRSSLYAPPSGNNKKPNPVDDFLCFTRRIITAYTMMDTLQTSSISLRMVGYSFLSSRVDVFPSLVPGTLKNLLTVLLSYVATGFVSTMIGGRSSITKSLWKVTNLKVSGFAAKTFLTHSRHTLNPLSISRDDLSTLCFIEFQYVVVKLEDG